MKKKDRSKEYARRSRKNRTGVKSFEMIPDGVQPVALGKRSVDVSDKVRQRLREEAKDLAVRLSTFEWKFLLEVIYGPHGCVRYKAMKKLRPYLADDQSRVAASKTWRSIKAKIGEEGIHEVIGLTVEKVDTTIVGGLDAKFQREFITRDGQIVQGPIREDRAVQLQAVGLAMKRLGLSKEPEPGSGPVVVQIVNYLADPKTALPWPGGGRSGPDGIMRPTVGPGSPGFPALPAARPDFTDRRNDRDD